MQVETRKYGKRPALTVGDTIGKWTVLELCGYDARVRCACGVEGYQRVATLLRDPFAQCRACRVAAARNIQPNLMNVSRSKVWQAIQQMTQLQMQYAAQLIRSRDQIDDERLTRADVIEAIEIARSLSPAQVEQELENLQPRYRAETWQSYHQYQSPKGVSL